MKRYKEDSIYWEILGRSISLVDSTILKILERARTNKYFDLSAVYELCCENGIDIKVSKEKLKEITKQVEAEK